MRWFAALLWMISCAPASLPMLQDGSPSAVSTEPQTNWYVVNLHSHMKCRMYARDDGRWSPEEDHKKFEEAGYDHNVHSIHSLGEGGYVPEDADWERVRKWEGTTRGTLEEADREWQKLREFESRLPLKIRRSLGAEVGVDRGPNYDPVEKNLNHVGAVGISRLVPSGMPVRKAMDWIHALGGIAVINHPGPPANGHWEPDYWQRPGIRELPDAIEVYNGNGSVFGIYYEQAYRQAVFEFGLPIAAVTGCDTHGRPHERRMEYTLVYARSPEIDDVVEAIRERRTIATLGLRDIKPVVAHLGEILNTRDVALSIDLGRPFEFIELWANGKAVQTWKDTATAEYTATLDKNTTYLWQFWEGKRGIRRGTTSPIMYRPDAPVLPDLAFGEGEGIVVSNLGNGPAGPFEVRAAEVVRHVQSLEAGASVVLDLPVATRTLVLIDPHSYDPKVDEDRINESNERNNARFFEPR